MLWKILEKYAVREKKISPAETRETKVSRKMKRSRKEKNDLLAIRTARATTLEPEAQPGAKTRCAAI